MDEALMLLNDWLGQRVRLLVLIGLGLRSTVRHLRGQRRDGTSR